MIGAYLTHAGLSHPGILTGGDSAVTSPTLGDLPQTDTLALKLLAAALTGAGLHAVMLRGGMLRASNPAAAADNFPGEVMSPGLSQIVAVETHDDGVSWFYWCWSGPTRDVPFELEPMCAVRDVDTAVARIVRVLALRDDTPAG